MKKCLSFIDFFKKSLLNEKGEVSEDVSSDDSGSEPTDESSGELSSEENDLEVVDSEIVQDQNEASEDVNVQAESEEELEQEIEEAIKEGASEEEVNEMIRQYTIKVDGKELVQELDLNDEEAIKKKLQLAYKGQMTMQEKAEQEKLFTNILNQLQADPFGTLQKLNPEFDPLHVSSEYINQLMKENEMSPEEKAEQERKTEYEQLKEERDRLIKEKQEAAAEAERQQMADEIQTDIMSALDSDPDLIADRDTVALVAENLMWAAKNNIDISAKDVLPTVKEQLRQNFEKAASRFKNPTSLKKYIGANLQEKLREERVKAAEKQIKNASSIKEVASKKETKKSIPTRKLSELFDS